jgi:hypothetical protein
MKSDGGLRQIWRARMPAVHWSSIETGGSEPGVPDMHGCLDGVAFWIEDKLSHGFAVEVRPAQIGWLSRYTRQGGRAFIAVRRLAEAGPRRGAAVDELWLFDGSLAAQLNREGLRGPAKLLLSEGGPAKWAWPRIGAVLLR